jgi:hypothetical protein
MNIRYQRKSTISKLLNPYRRFYFDIELSISILKLYIEASTSISTLQLRYRSYNFDFEVFSTILSKVTSLHRGDLTVIMYAHRGTSAIPAGTVRFHGLRDSHVEKFATLCLVSNKTSFFNTPAHRASLSNVIKGLREKASK